MRTVLVALMLASPAVWANPPAAKTVEAKKATTAAKVEPRKAEPKPEMKPDLKLEHHVEAKKADAAGSTLTLNAPRKKPARRATLPDWTP